MKTKPVLTLDDARKMACAAEKEAVKNGWIVSIAVVDDGGHPLYFQRMDNAAPLSAHICTAKAKTAALGGRESRVFEDMINGGRTAFLSAPAIAGMLEGGIPVILDGVCVGAVGVSGGRAAEEAPIAKAGVNALTN